MDFISHSKTSGIYVTIDVEYDLPTNHTLPSPPNYLLAAPVILTCQFYGAIEPVSYRWSSTGLMSFVVNSTSPTLRKKLCTSDAGNHTCTVIDSTGNTGNNTIEMQIMGKYYF